MNESEYREWAQGMSFTDAQMDRSVKLLRAKGLIETQHEYSFRWQTWFVYAIVFVAGFASGIEYIKWTLGASAS